MRRLADRQTISVHGLLTRTNNDIEFRISPELTIPMPLQIPAEVLDKGPREMTITAIIHPHAYNGNSAQVIDLIKHVVYQEFEVTPSQLNSQTRKREILVPRQLIMYLVWKHVWPVVSWVDIGGMYGKDHATAIHAVKSIKCWLLDKHLGWGDRIRRCADIVQNEVDQLKVKKTA